MNFMGPPQTRHVSMWMLNTPFKRCAQVIGAWLAAGWAASGPHALTLAPRPRRPARFGFGTSATPGRRHSSGIDCWLYSQYFDKELPKYVINDLRRTPCFDSIGPLSIPLFSRLPTKYIAQVA
jgi:hypothetical protein